MPGASHSTNSINSINSITLPPNVSAGWAEVTEVGRNSPSQTPRQPRFADGSSVFRHSPRSRPRLKSLEPRVPRSLCRSLSLASLPRPSSRLDSLQHRYRPSDGAFEPHRIIRRGLSVAPDLRRESNRHFQGVREFVHDLAPDDGIPSSHDCPSESVAPIWVSRANGTTSHSSSQICVAR